MLRKIDDAVGRVAGWANNLAALALLATFALLIVEIVLRNALIPTFGIGMEYSTYLLVMMIFAALAMTQRSGGMIYMEIVYDRLPPRLRGGLNVVRWSLTLVYCVIATWHVTIFTARTCALGQVSDAQSRTPLCAPQSMMVVGLFLLTVVVLCGLVRALCDWRNNNAAPAQPAANPL